MVRVSGNLFACRSVTKLWMRLRPVIWLILFLSMINYFSFLFPQLPPTCAHTLQTTYSKLWLCIGIILIVLLNLLEALLKYLWSTTWWTFRGKQLSSAIFFGLEVKWDNDFSWYARKILGSKSLPSAGILCLMRWLFWQAQVCALLGRISVDEDVRMKLPRELVCSFWTSNFSSIKLCLLNRV